IPARDAGLDASDAAPAHDGGRDAALDAGRDAGGCAVACGDPTPICNPATRSCVACLVDPDCDDGDPCTVDRCGIDNACSHADDSSCIAEVSAGFRHTCARRVSGQVLCWGDNLYGEAGNGRSGRQELTPVTTSFLTDARDVSAGFDFSCAVR